VSARPDEELVSRLVRFGRVLRDHDMEVGPGRLQDSLRALRVVGPCSRDDAYWALRCALISRHQDIEVFDDAFARFWRWPRAPEVDEPPVSQPREEGRDGVAGAKSAAPRELMGDADGGEGPESEEGHVGETWSAVERLRELDFAEYTDEELRAARRLVERVARAVPRRVARRLEAAHSGRQLDKRRMLRDALRTDGYPVERYWRRRRRTPRKLVFLIDVSGSMEPYARATIMFLQAAVGAGRKVEGFTFGTRLTSVTAELEGRDPDRALRAATRAVPDWAGGTLIGANIRAFNETCGRRGLTRGATVVIVSDGWERADPELVGREMERLRRVAHSIVWVNPLAGEPGYEPLAQGMAAALPHVDFFLPGHNLKSVEALAGVLESLPSARSGLMNAAQRAAQRPTAAPSRNPLEPPS
jgi:uncharacterized protein with von Willebrand factor type A (vWA) domain